MQGCSQLFGGEDQTEVMRVGAGVVAISPFGIDIGTSGKGVGFRAQFPRAEADDQIETGEEFGPAGLMAGKEFGRGEVFQKYSRFL
jgi:hypothetical protein